MIKRLFQNLFIMLPFASMGQINEDSLLTVGYTRVLEVVADTLQDPIYVDPKIKMKNPPAEINGKKLIVLNKKDHYAFRDKIPANTIIFTIYHIKISDTRYSINIYPEIFTGEMIYDGSSYDPELVLPDKIAKNAFNVELVFKFMTPKNENDWELWDTYELTKIE